MEPIDAERIDELLRFLPLFEAPGFEPFAAAVEGFGYPVYVEPVSEFFRLAGQPCWTDFDYQPRRAADLLADDARLSACGLAELRSLLTYCVRSERFCDGAWGQLIRDGRLAALLRRLARLRAEPGG